MIGMRKIIIRCLQRSIAESKFIWVKKFAAYIVENITPILTCHSKYGLIKYYCPGHIPYLRALNSLEQEPETLQWLDSFSPDAIFWDIGANIGVFSLYAGMKGIRVYSFEPSPSSYFVLNKNVNLNQLSHLITTFCVALNKDTGISTLYYSRNAIGSAGISYSTPYGWSGEPLEVTYQQEMIGFDIMSFYEIFDVPAPTHIKIDVDGLEEDILLGADPLLSSGAIQSVLTEIDVFQPQKRNRIIEYLGQAGLELEAIADTTSRVKNHIFRR
jgi:FkbM family methyltransferase